MAIFQHYFTWILSLHIMAFISWMAGLFYLPRLFVYHTQVEPGTKEDQRFCLMEKRLYRQIMTPAMVVTFLTGILMTSLPHVINWQSLWWWVKIFAVLGMAGFQGICHCWRRDFSLGENKHSERFYRCVNEIPTILMMIIVVMIIVRP